MIRELTIKKNGVKTHGAISSDFDSIESFDAWILKMQEIKAWGEVGEYTIEIQDITTRVEAQNLINEGKKRQEIGALIIAKVHAINEGKALTAEQFNAILNDPTLERIERLLWSGSLKTAKIMIQTLDTTFFTEEEKQSVLDMLSEY